MPIAVKAVTTTSLGTGTTKTLLTGAVVKVPSWSRKLLSVRVTVYPETPKTQISYNAKFSLESDDVPNLVPFIMLAPPAAANISTNTDSIIPVIAEYIVNAPTVGGENLKLYGQMLLADATTAVYMGMDLKFGTAGAVLPYDPLPGVQRHAMVGTWTAAVAAGTATGTVYTVVGGKRIIEAVGMVNSITTTASKPSAGEFLLVSSGLKLNPLSWTAQPVGAFIGTGKPNVMGLSRTGPVDYPIDSVTDLTDSFTDIIGLATDYWITGVIYI
ncbi:hypothetical protein KAR91_45855 [Candidatus Pacearchaeota archaeon]|nr:hypothetical protein [Candidatus Pacearchaeota archaeon]